MFPKINNEPVNRLPNLKKKWAVSENEKKKEKRRSTLLVMWSKKKVLFL